MRRRQPPAPTQPYLEAQTCVQVRFQEVDALQVVWHGHYISYFEDARAALGERFGISYIDLKNAGVAAPVVHVSCDYCRPARFGDELLVTVRLLAHESAKIECLYTVEHAQSHETLAYGRTLQVFTDFNGEMLLVQPDVLRQVIERHQGELRQPDAK